MTNQHPLTDETCEDLSSCITMLTAPGGPDPYICPQYVADDMRAAADWQLKQVTEWLEVELVHSSYIFGGSGCIDYYNLFKDFKKAVRPATQEEN